MDEKRVITKVSRRFLWFLLLMFMVNFIDRTNIGFAALSMNKELHLSASTFSIALAAFSAVYLLCEIPSNLILERVGARRWLARIAVSWGIASSACMLAVGAKSLIGIRMLVGVSEAGFAPGSVLYLTYWFPQYERARAHTKFMLSQPVAGAIGATLSGLLLGLDGLWGVSGWRWLFLVEGVPSILLGVIAWFYLTDRPKDARWLSDEEKATLIACLKRDAEERDRNAPPPASRSVTRIILSRNFLLVSLAYGCLIGNLNALVQWTPQILRAATGAGMPYWQIGLLTAIPPACTLVFMPIWSWSSDRMKERFWHCVLPLLAGAVGWSMAAGLHRPGLQLLGLVITNMSCVAAWPIFFTLPSIMLPRNSHAAAIAFINVVGIAGTVVTPLIMGFMKDFTGSFAGPMGVMGAILVLGAALMAFVPRQVLKSAAEPLRQAAAAQ